MTIIALIANKLMSWLKKVLVMRSLAKGTKPSEEAKLMRAEVLERRLKREGLLIDETLEANPSEDWIKLRSGLHPPITGLITL